MRNYVISASIITSLLLGYTTMILLHKKMPHPHAGAQAPTPVSTVGND